MIEGGPGLPLCTRCGNTPDSAVSGWHKALDQADRQSSLETQSSESSCCRRQQIFRMSDLEMTFKTALSPLVPDS